MQQHSSANPKTSRLDYDGVYLTNAQRHMLPISKLWYQESLIMQLKYAYS